MDWQNRARAGQPLRVSATAYNAFVEAAIATRRGSTMSSAGSSSLPGGYVDLVNKSPSKIAAFTPRVIEGVSTTTAPPDRFSRPTLTTSFPYQNRPDRMQAIAVTQQEIAVNGAGIACVSGVTWCRVDQSQANLMFPGVRLGVRVGNGDASGDALRIDSLGPAVMLSVPIDTGTTDAHGAIWLAVVSLGIREDAFWARIEAASLVTPTAPVWSYQWQEVVIDKDAAPTSADPWSEEGGGGELVLRSSTSWGEALNTLEAGNTGSLAYGISIGAGFKIGNTNFSFRPVPSGAIVQMRYSSRWGALDIAQGGHYEVLFSAPNPVAGTCGNLQIIENYPYYDTVEDAVGPVSGIVDETGSQE
jgi:hypothetical protein